MRDDAVQRWADEAEVRCPVLAKDGFDADAVAAARAAAVSWRWSRAESGTHRPQPFAAERRGNPSAWLEEPPQYGSADRVGFDEAGRPTIVVSWFEGRESRVVELWEHADGRSTGLWRLDDTVGSEPRASVTILDDPARPTLVVRAGQGSSWIDGVPIVELTLERWAWDGDRVVRGELWPASAASDWQGAGGTMILMGFSEEDDEPFAGEPAVVEPSYDANGTLVALSVDGRPVLGEAADAWFDDFRQRMQDRVDAFGMAGDDDPTIDDEWRTDREALTAELVARGVSGAEAIVREHAVVALRLEPRDGSDGTPLPATRRYGKRGLLPPGEPWPLATNGRALGFLAAIDLSELPGESLGTTNPLPPAGWLLFFADLDTADDEGRSWEQGTFLGEGYPNTEGEPSRVLWVPAGEAPVDADPPPLRAKSAALPETRCAVVPQLQLPTSWEAREALGLPEDEEDVYAEVAHRLSPWFADFVLGNASGVQGHGSEPGEVVLLHLGSAEFQDGGNVQFRLPASALATGDWAEIHGYGESN